MLVLVIVAVLIVVALATVVIFLLSAPPPQPPEGLDRVEISLQPSVTTLDQRELVVASAKAIDTQGLDQTSNATSIVWSASPGSAVQIQPSAVPWTVQVTAMEPGAVNLTASATWQGSTVTGSRSLSIRALQLNLTTTKSIVRVGAPFLLTVKAIRPDATTATTYMGEVNFTSDDPQATLPANTTFSVSDLGRKDFTGVVIRKSGAVRITAKDTLIPTIVGTIDLTGNRLPVPNFTLTENPFNPLEITVNGTPSFDPDPGDSIVAYTWSFGDGSPPVSTAVASHTYASAGTYTIRLTVQDSRQASNSTTRSYVARARPTASFVIAGLVPAGADVLLLVNASASSDPDGTIVNYNWTWGDGNFTDTANPETSHLYNSSFVNQSVTVVLVVTDNDALTGTASRSVTITLVQVPPVAVFSISLVDQANRTVFVDASASFDLNANLVYYNWSWGDGSAPTNLTVPTASHAYASDGNFTINLTVVDSTNLKNWTEQAVMILQPDLPPNAAFTVTRTKFHVDVDASASTDPNGDIATYEWNWGDGNTTAPSASPLAAHDYAVAGLYSIILTVRDAKSLSGTTTRKASVASSTIDYVYYDFFNVPFGDWWDYRTAVYGEMPIMAECFNQTSIDNGVCVPTDANISDTPSYPYTYWYPLPGNIKWDNPNNRPEIYAPYRFRTTGVDVPGYNLSEPVFLPVFNYSAAPGATLDFDWRMQYIDTATADFLATLFCPGTARTDLDGWNIRSVINLTMDLQQSRRIFGVEAADAASAQAWWYNNIDDFCFIRGPIETAIDTWFILMGGSAAQLGKYDIANGYEWYYQAFYTQMNATVDPDGTTHVTIDHAAWGTEALLARMFYWGNASYVESYLNSTNASGWWGMDLAWWEDLNFTGSLDAAGLNFGLSSVMQYHFQLQTFPGVNGVYDQIDDVPYWSWGPWLNDYVDNIFPKHQLSYLDRYPGLTYVHSTPGGFNYGQSSAYDYTPISWNLKVGQTWHFEFPTGDVVFYDPNQSPIPSNPKKDLVQVFAPLKLHSTNPAGYGDWDAQAKTWDVLGPSDTGGPAGTTGPDGIAGTADDEYPLDPWGMINLTWDRGGSLLVASSFLEALVYAPTDRPAASAAVLPQATTGVSVAAAAPVRVLDLFLRRKD